MTDIFVCETHNSGEINAYQSTVRDLTSWISSEKDHDGRLTGIENLTKEPQLADSAYDLLGSDLQSLIVDYDIK